MEMGSATNGSTIEFQARDGLRIRLRLEQTMADYLDIERLIGRPISESKKHSDVEVFLATLLVCGEWIPGPKPATLREVAETINTSAINSYLKASKEANPDFLSASPPIPSPTSGASPGRSEAARAGATSSRSRSGSGTN